MFGVPPLVARGALAASLLACGQTPQPTPERTSAAPAEVHRAPSLTFAAPKRLIAIGDLHGDLGAASRALTLGGAIDKSGEWVGGDLFVVQTGDEIDRGDDDRAVLDLFDRLAEKAKPKGGTVLALNGNHELMNAQLDFRYVTEGAYRAFDEFSGAPPAGMPPQPDAHKGRAAAFFPGGAYATKLAERPVVAIVGDSVFVHGGVSPKHVAYGLEKLDAETRDWLRGKRPAPPPVVVAEDGVVWMRSYSAAPGKEECDMLAKTLASLGAKRLVMGHTPQKPDISPACGEAAWRIDTGMSHHYGGPVEVLQIEGDRVTVLRE